MRVRLLGSIGMMLSLYSCNPQEIERLQAENDSLRKELEMRGTVISAMNDVKILIDSIDASRNALHTVLAEGTTYDHVVTRLRDVSAYIKKTREKLSGVESRLRAATNEASAYLMMVDALKGELDIRDGEISRLEKSLSAYRGENQALINTVKLQEAELSDMQLRIAAKEQELSLLEAKIDELVENFKVSEAEAYYARAKAVEEAGNRTRLARHKKKETYREAIELYKKALSLGKTEAQASITQLEKRVQ